jgi:hypothetical protein
MLDVLEATPRMQVRDFGVLNFCNGLTHWTYRTSHTRDDVLDADYFVSVRDMMGAGDWIFVSASDGPMIFWARGNELGVTLERVR